jgi:phage terminase large subunit-like protein
MLEELKQLKDELAEVLGYDDRVERLEWKDPYPWIIPPANIPPLGVWLMMGGRGTAKTSGAAHYVLEHVNGPPCSRHVRGGHRIGIVAPTLGDALESCVNGPTGLKAYDPDVRQLGLTHVIFPNGSEGKLFGAHGPDDVERLRGGGGRCLYWWEELAAWVKLEQAMAQSRLGLKLYKKGHIVASTTPRPKPALKKLVKSPTTIVTHGRTADAYLMDPAIREAMLAEYGGTRLARQELEGEILEDVEGALWSGTNIERHRWTVLPGGGYRPPGGAEDVTKVPEMARVVVGVDPAGGQGEGNDETGIVVCGRVGYGLSAQYFVLGDYSLRGSPMAWASAVAVAFDKHEADRVVAEKNFGGDMVEHTLRSVRPNLAIKMVTASRGKTQRAEPISALYEKGLVHHVGMFSRLEDQMTGFDPNLGKYVDASGSALSPDRADALIWALTDLLETPPPRRGARVNFYPRTPGVR